MVRSEDYIDSDNYDDNNDDDNCNDHNNDHNNNKNVNNNIHRCTLDCFFRFREVSLK